MLSLKDASTKITPRGTHLVIHGIGGSGKTTFGANITKNEKGIMLLLGEEGLSPLKIEGVMKHEIGCKVEPGDEAALVNAWNDYKNILKELITTQHTYTTLVQDSFSTFITNVFDPYIIKTYYNGNKDKADAYAAKYAEYQSEFSKIIEAWKVILSKGINIVTLLHSVSVDARDPMVEKYNRWDLNLPIGNKMNMANMLYNHADAVFFVSKDVNVDDHKATGKRFVARTSPDAAYVSKPMRLPEGKSLPDKFEFKYEIYKQLLKGAA
jgi:hypothetical protein